MSCTAPRPFFLLLSPPVPAPALPESVAGMEARVELSQDSEKSESSSSSARLGSRGGLVKMEGAAARLGWFVGRLVGWWAGGESAGSG